MIEKYSKASGISLERLCTQDWIQSTDAEYGVEFFEAFFQRNGYQKHRHDTYAICLPTTLPKPLEYNMVEWDKLWAVAEEAGMVVCFHVGTGSAELIVTRGPGGALINYWETTVPAQRCVVHLLSSGALDRFRKLKVLTAEAGCGRFCVNVHPLCETLRICGRSRHFVKLCESQVIVAGRRFTTAR